MKCLFNVDGLKLIDKIERKRERRPVSQALFNELLKYLHSPVAQRSNIGKLFYVPMPPLRRYEYQSILFIKSPANLRWSSRNFSDPFCPIKTMRFALAATPNRTFVA